MKKPKKKKNKKGGLSAGPDRSLAGLKHKPDIKIITVNNYVQNITVVQGGGGTPMDADRRKFIEKCIAFAGGFAFVVSLLVLTVFIPEPTVHQLETFRSVMAVGLAGCAAVIPGFLDVKFGKWLGAGGALAVFVLVYFYSPAVLGLK